MDYEKRKIEERLAAIRKEVRYVRLMEAPAMIAVGFGLFAKFGKNPETLHPLFADATVVNSVLAVAVPWVAICTIRTIKLLMEGNRLGKGLRI